MIKPKHLIHEKLKKHSPHGVRKAKKLVGFKYPKFVILILCIVLAYFVFSNGKIQEFASAVEPKGNLGVFISGILLSIGFTAPFGVGFLLTANTGNIFLASTLGGIGGMFADLMIFKFIKFSFKKEFDELKKEKVMVDIERIIQNDFPTLMKHYMIYAFGGIILASPLPDEIGVSMLAGLSSVDDEKLAALSFVFHFIGIFILVYLGNFV